MAESPRPPSERKPEGLQHFASRHVLQAIIRGELRPGDKLSPTKIASHLEISHIPVREALAAMEASGHVVRVPRVGFFVADQSLEDLDDVYHWRQVLEDEAHRLAIPKLDESDLSRMRRINRAASNARIYSTKYLELNREFHFVAFERVGSKNLLRFLNHLWDASLRHQNAMSSVALPRTLLQEQHEELINAFRARDLTLVNARMAEHRHVTIKAVGEMVAAERDPTQAYPA
jgi:DNA-binding GntR family transcriptional regulator